MTITKEAKVFDIGTVPLIGEFELIAIPTLIEVQTIKKKIVEQMSETRCSEIMVVMCSELLDVLVPGLSFIPTAINSQKFTEMTGWIMFRQS
jgi:hypothetical protein